MNFPLSFEGRVDRVKRINTKTGRSMHVVTVSFMGGNKDFFLPDEAVPDALMGKSVKVSCLFNLSKFRLEDVRVETV